MANVNTRELSTRERDQRAMNMYTPPSTLPEPTPEPGWTFYWVATHVLGQSDPSNVSKRFRDGYIPCKVVDHPELQLQGDANGNVEVGGLMLCKMPSERAKARSDYYRAQAAAQMESVDNHFMRNNDPRMPLFKERTSKAERGFGSGSK